jgi:hypothetical protein
MPVWAMAPAAGTAAELAHRHQHQQQPSRNFSQLTRVAG